MTTATGVVSSNRLIFTQILIKITICHVLLHWIILSVRATNIRNTTRVYIVHIHSYCFIISDRSRKLREFFSILFVFRLVNNSNEYIPNKSASRGLLSVSSFVHEDRHTCRNRKANCFYCQRVCVRHAMDIYCAAPRFGCPERSKAKSLHTKVNLSFSLPYCWCFFDSTSVPRPSVL